MTNFKKILSVSALALTMSIAATTSADAAKWVNNTKSPVDLRIFKTQDSALAYLREMKGAELAGTALTKVGELAVKAAIASQGGGKTALPEVADAVKPVANATTETATSPTLITDAEKIEGAKTSAIELAKLTTFPEVGAKIIDSGNIISDAMKKVIEAAGRGKSVGTLDPGQDKSWNWEGMLSGKKKGLLGIVNKSSGLDMKVEKNTQVFYLGLANLGKIDGKQTYQVVLAKSANANALVTIDEPPVK